MYSNFGKRTQHSFYAYYALKLLNFILSMICNLKYSFSAHGNAFQVYTYTLFHIKLQKKKKKKKNQSSCSFIILKTEHLLLLLWTSFHPTTVGLYLV